MVFVYFEVDLFLENILPVKFGMPGRLGIPVKPGNCPETSCGEPNSKTSPTRKNETMVNLPIFAKMFELVIF